MRDDDMHDANGQPLTLYQAMRDLHDAGAAFLEATRLPALAIWILDRLTRLLSRLTR